MKFIVYKHNRLILFNKIRKFNLRSWAPSSGNEKHSPNRSKILNAFPKAIFLTNSSEILQKCVFRYYATISTLFTSILQKKHKIDLP